MRLNLGCGDDIRQGYTNVDFRRTHPSVEVVDLSKFPWPFPDGSAEEILMLDFLEHFPYRQTQKILLECYRVLKPNGELVVQVPDGIHLMMAFVRSGKYLCNGCGETMSSEYGTVNRSRCSCGQSASDISEAAMRRLFGGQDYEGNYHQTCFTQQSLWEKAASCGFSDAVMEESEHQWKNWNIKMRLRKGDIW